VAAWGGYQLDVYAVGGTDQVWRKYWVDGSWGPGWAALGPSMFNGAPAAVSWGANRMDIFAVGPLGVMYHKAWAGNWVPPALNWEPLGAAPCEGGFNNDSAPAAVSWGANRLDVFAVGADSQMYHKCWIAP
jgi:hypothetical protein